MSEPETAEPMFRWVANRADLPPGALLRVEVGARLVCLANVDDAVYAFDNECPHIGGALDEGELDGCLLTCPVHFACFNLRAHGRVVRGPAQDDLVMLPVRIDGDAILVAEVP